MLGMATEFPAGDPMPHSILLSGGFRFRFILQSPWRPIIYFHPETETHVGQNFFDLVQGFPPEVFRCQDLRLGLLNKIANILDVRVFQTIGGADRELQFIHTAKEVLIQQPGCPLALWFLPLLLPLQM